MAADVYGSGVEGRRLTAFADAAERAPRRARETAENELSAELAMIETAEGLANLEAICATPGLDAVYVGPADLSLALGLAPRADNPDPLHMETCDKIRDTAHRHGIKAVMHCAGADFAAGAVKRGFDMVMLTSDLACLMAGVRQQLEAFKSQTG